MDEGADRVLACNIALIGITTLCISVKLYTRVELNRTTYWDDIFAVIGYVCAMVVCIINSVLTRHGLGRHIETVTPADLTTILRVNFVTELAYVFSFVTGKLAFVFFYLSIFPSPTCRRVNYALATVLVLQLIEETIVVCLQCTPLRKAWDLEAPGTCLDLILFFYVSFGAKLATDIVLFCLPIPMLGSLNIGRWKKICVMAMFSLGLLVCVVSIIRITLIKSTSKDITSAVLLAVQLNWSAIEICSITICFCIPSFLAFIRLSPFLSSLFRISAATVSTRSSKSKSSSRVRNSYPLRARGKWTSGLGKGRGVSTMVTSVRLGDEEAGNFNESQLDILAAVATREGERDFRGDERGEGGESRAIITVVKSVRVESIREVDEGK